MAFQSRMIKILNEQENGIIITNPRDRMGAFFRKLAYRLAVWSDWVRRISGREPDQRDR